MPDAPAEAAPAAHRWRLLLRPRWVGWHLFAVAAVTAMVWLGDWQFRRAESGNALSWAYTFEWPIFAVFGVVFWYKTVRDELRPPAAAAVREEVRLPDGAGRRPVAGPGPGDDGDAGQPALGSGQARPGAGARDDEDDTELAEYNAYLAKLNAEVRGHGRWHGLR